jgi:hypothetical protein
MFEFIASGSDPIELSQALDHGQPVFHHMPKELRGRMGWWDYATRVWKSFEAKGADVTGKKIFRTHEAGGICWAEIIAATRDTLDISAEGMINLALQGKLQYIPSLMMSKDAHELLIRIWERVFQQMVVTENMIKVNQASILDRLCNGCVATSELGDFQTVTDWKFKRDFPKADGYVDMGGHKIPITVAEYRSGSFRIGEHRLAAVLAEREIELSKVNVGAIRSAIESFLTRIKTVERWVVLEGFEDVPEVQEIIGRESVEVF